MAVQLKGDFDLRLRNAINNVRNLQQVLRREQGRPKNWSPAQLQDLKACFDAITDIAGCVEDIAVQVRDD
jgi:hypothetical protein